MSDLILKPHGDPEDCHILKDLHRHSWTQALFAEGGAMPTTNCLGTRQSVFSTTPLISVAISPEDFVRSRSAPGGGSMSESVYRKTPLPVRLDLNKRNTREQLSQGQTE